MRRDRGATRVRSGTHDRVGPEHQVGVLLRQTHAHREPAVRNLQKRVHAAPYTGKLFADDDPFDSEVTITLADGRTFTEKVDRPLGRTSDNAIAHEHMKAKFENCAARVLTIELSMAPS